MFAIRYMEDSKKAFLQSVPEPSIEEYKGKPRAYIKEIANRFKEKTGHNYSVGFVKKF